MRFKGARQYTGDRGFVGIGRKRLLDILQACCEAPGVTRQVEAETGGDEDFLDPHLVNAADGINSKNRNK